jgi:hypothetical protein
MQEFPALTELCLALVAMWDEHANPHSGILPHGSMKRALESLGCIASLRSLDLSHAWSVPRTHESADIIDEISSLTCLTGLTRLVHGAKPACVAALLPGAEIHA